MKIFVCGLFCLSVWASDVWALTLEQRISYNQSMAEIDASQDTDHQKRMARFEIDLHYSHLKRVREKYVNTLSLSERIRFVCQFEQSENYVCEKLRMLDDTRK